MAAQNHPRHPPRTERNDDAATGRDAMAQSLRQRVSERLIERNRQTYVAEVVITVGHRRRAEGAMRDGAVSVYNAV